MFCFLELQFMFPTLLDLRQVFILPLTPGARCNWLTQLGRLGIEPFRNCSSKRRNISSKQLGFELPSGVIKHGLLEDTLFVGDFPIETCISSGFPIATVDYQRVTKSKMWFFCHCTQCCFLVFAWIFKKEKNSSACPWRERKRSVYQHHQHQTWSW